MLQRTTSIREVGCTLDCNKLAICSSFLLHCENTQDLQWFSWTHDSLSGSLSHPGVSPGPGHWGYQQHRSGLWDSFPAASQPNIYTPLSKVVQVFVWHSIVNSHSSTKTELYANVCIQVSGDNLSQMVSKGNNNRSKGHAGTWSQRSAGLL